MKYVFLIIAITLMSCTSDNLSTADLLRGKWIEVNTKSDTLVFGLFGDQEAMMVNRGYEIRDSFRLPKHGSGPYDYRISKNKIALHSYLSSSMGYKDYMRMLLFLEGKERMSMRAMGIIEKNMQSIYGQPAFRIDYCAGRMEIRTVCNLRRGIKYQYRTYYGYQ